jgi:hypothetical protein
MAQRGNDPNLRQDPIPPTYREALWEILGWVADEGLIPPDDPVLSFVSELAKGRTGRPVDLTFADTAPYAEQVAAAIDLLIRMRGWDRGISAARTDEPKRRLTARVEPRRPST